jgi:hypothetical protein
MMNPFNWTCRFCGHRSTVTEPNHSSRTDFVETDKSKYKSIAITHKAIACPNPDCEELSLSVRLNLYHKNDVGFWSEGEILHNWSLLPRSLEKPIPEYVPSPIREDYREACCVISDSPKAAATLARRCLQGVVRDFWAIPKSKRGNLASELNSISEKVDPDTWSAIEAIRKVGNIGAHMERDASIIVDVGEDEAELLIELIETLIQDWYIDKHKRAERSSRARALVEAKDRARSGQEKPLDNLDDKPHSD